MVELTCQMLEFDGVGISLLDPGMGKLRLVALAARSEAEKALYYENFARFSLSDYLDEPAIARLSNNEMVVR